MMNAETSSTPRKPRALGWQISVLAFCVLLALSAALFWKQRQSTPPAIAASSPAPKVVQLSAEQILAKIPAPTGESATDQSVAASLAKVRENPKVAAPWVNLGDSLAQVLRYTANAKYYDFAELAYQRALKLDPRSIDAMSGMAWVTGGRHLFDQSISWANRALTIDPGHASSHGFVGDAARELGDYDKASSEYQKMMDLRPDLSSWSRGSYLLWLTGNRTKAMRLIEKAIKAESGETNDRALCRAKLALFLFEDGAYAPAANALKPALAADPENVHACLAAGRIAAARRDLPAAKQYYQKVLAARPNHEALVALGDLEAVAGRKEEAEGYYLKVEALHRERGAPDVDDDLLLAKFYADHDRNLGEALRLIEPRMLTRNVLEADTVAWVLFKNGDLTHAREVMRRALRQRTPLAEFHYHAGMMAAATDDRSTAQRELGQALSLNPKFDPLQAPIAVQKLREIGGHVPTSSPSPRAFAAPSSPPD